MNLEALLKDRQINSATLIKELDYASAVQQGFLAEFPTDKGLDIAASLHPAETIGGDVYDLLRSDDEQMLLYIGDVTGHGIPAGLVMAHVSSLLMTLARFCHSPREILIEANALLQRKVKQGTFMTTMLCQWDIKLQRFSYTSAGHERLIHYQAATRSIKIYPPGGIALGIMADISSLMVEVEVPLQTGDFVVLYSDGIPEAHSTEHGMLGMPRFTDIIHQNAHFSDSKQIHDHIMHDVYNYIGGYPKTDDITLMVVRRG